MSRTIRRTNSDRRITSNEHLRERYNYYLSRQNYRHRNSSSTIYHIPVNRRPNVYTVSRYDNFETNRTQSIKNRNASNVVLQRAIRKASNQFKPALFEYWARVNEINKKQKCKRAHAARRANAIKAYSQGKRLSKPKRQYPKCK